MPGHNVARSAAKNTALFDKYQCPCCDRLLKDAVQPLCGHWHCESCIIRLLASSSPKCPRPDCLEDLQADGNSEQGTEYFPDRFVRREINGMIIGCTHQAKGCNWEDKLAKLDHHLSVCQFSSLECPHCEVTVSPDQLETHKRTCSKVPMKCPLAGFGCSHSEIMPRFELEKHILDHGVEHLQTIADCLKQVQKQPSSCKPDLISFNSDLEESDATGQNFYHDSEERDFAGPSKVKAKGEIKAVVSSPRTRRVETDSYSTMPDENLLSEIGLNKIAKSLRIEMESKLSSRLHSKDEEIRDLKNTITKMDKAMRTKHAEFEDRDFRLSLIENCNYEGFMIWKIPQFSQRMADAQTGKYTSIFSLPFYSGRYGYKMCLRLYILGDGIGKNSHMSLFFVIMKGEFDNILQWPFTHKVTFKLLNQTGGRDIVDTFQPDPMSSSFRKPKSDMNIASGCPRFVSHSELKSGGFIVDDTVFIKCAVDTNTMKHP